MGWLDKKFDKWFDETDWPQDPSLDLFRDAVWGLSLNGEAKGWVTASVSPMRSFPLFWVKQERMWTQVHWSDGEHDYLEEDYGPDWPVAADLRAGHLDTFDIRAGLMISLDATPVTGAERDSLWARLDHGVEPYNRR